MITNVIKVYGDEIKLSTEQKENKKSTERQKINFPKE